MTSGPHTWMTVLVSVYNPLNPKIKIQIPIRGTCTFPKEVVGELVEVSFRFIVCDHFLNLCHQCVLQSIDILRSHLMLITLRA